MFVNKQLDAVEKIELEDKMKKSLACWSSAWSKIPENWIETNSDSYYFDPARKDVFVQASKIIQSEIHRIKTF